MPNKYYARLLETLQPDGELAQLQYDIQNCPPAMKEIATKLHNTLAILLYHTVALTEMLVHLNVLQRCQPAPTAPTPVAPTRSTLPFPAPPIVSLPGLVAPSSAPGGSPGDPAPCGVPQVVITSQGTKVIPAAGTGAAPVVLPPHTPVRLDQMQVPVAPPQVDDGVPQVNLPRGGDLPPEVQSALSHRQG